MRKIGSIFSLLTVSAGLVAALGCGPPPKPVALVQAPPPPPPPDVQVARPVDPQLVDLTGTPGSTAVLAGVAGDVTVRIRVEARAMPRTQRPPLNLGLVIDTSGSMAGQAIDDARAAAIALVDQLEPGDRLAVVVFHSRTEILVPSLIISKANVADIKARLGAMQATGTTDMGNGLAVGLQQVEANYRQDGLNRVVLLGDGVPNDPSALAGLAQRAASEKITMTMLGLGVDYDETLMAALAQQTGGTFRYLDDSTKVAQAFEQEITRMTRVVARGIMLRLQAGPGVVIKSVSGQPGQTGTALAFGLGDLSENERRDLVVRLSAPGRKAGATVELLDAQLSFEDMVAGAGALERHSFVGVRAGDARDVAAGADDEVMRLAARAALAEAVLAAIATARAGQVPEARGILTRAAREAAAALKLRDDPELRAKLAELPALEQSLPTLAPPQEVAQPTAADTTGPTKPGRKKLPQPSPTPQPEPPTTAPSIIKGASSDAAETLSNPRPTSN